MTLGTFTENISLIYRTVKSRYMHQFRSYLVKIFATTIQSHLDNQIRYTYTNTRFRMGDIRKIYYKWRLWIQLLQNIGSYTSFRQCSINVLFDYYMISFTYGDNPHVCILSDHFSKFCQEDIFLYLIWN